MAVANGIECFGLYNFIYFNAEFSVFQAKHSSPLDRHVSSDLPPEATSLIQHVHFDIIKPTTFNHVFLSCSPILWHTRLAPVREFVSIRIASLKERSEGSCEAVINQGLGLLDRGYLVPLYIVSFLNNQRKVGIMKGQKKYPFSIASMLRW
jgi:hypothetical protein